MGGGGSIWAGLVLEESWSESQGVSGSLWSMEPWFELYVWISSLSLSNWGGGERDWYPGGVVGGPVLSPSRGEGGW